MLADVLDSMLMLGPKVPELVKIAVGTTKVPESVIVLAVTGLLKIVELAG